MSVVFSITAPIYLIILLGYMAAKKNFFPENMEKSLSLFVFYFSMPAFLFISMAKVPVQLLVNWHYIVAYALSMGLTALIAWGFARIYFKRNLSSSILASLGACYTNSGFVGVPIMQAFFGSPGPMIVISLFQILLVTTIALIFLEALQNEADCKKNVLHYVGKTIAFNPIIVASIAGVMFAAQQWPVPKLVDSFCQLMGGAGIPGALFALGLSLGKPLPVLSADKKGLIAVLIFLKIAVHPLLAYFVGVYFFNLEAVWLWPLVLAAAIPTAVNIFVFAQRYESFGIETERLVFLTSVLSFFTLSAIIFCAHSG